jgi:peptidoglycan/LPS O-acetylase OafA/YrhL
MTRRLDIQGLRAVAVLLVIAYHAGLHVPGGFTGVDVFFVISGFVITGTLLGELTSNGQISFSRFYVRRVKRLLPALAVVLIFVALVGILADPIAAQHMSALTGVFASFFSANVYLDHLPTGYFDVATTINPLLHTWTLAVEEQFYVVFPTLLAIGWWLGRSRLARGRRREVAFGIIAAACIVSFLLSYSLSRGYFPSGSRSHEKLAFYASPTRAWEFGVGALVVLATPLLARLPAWGARALGVAGAAAIAVTAFSHLDTIHNPETTVLLPVAGSCLLLAAGIPGTFWVSRLLGLRPLVWVGDLSYSLYLWHWPLIVFARALYPDHLLKAAAAAAVISFLPAWLSYRYVENPIRYHARLGSRSRVAGRTALVLASVCILLPVGANFGLLGAHRALNATASIRNWRGGSRLHADVVRGCNSTTPLGERKGAACTWSVGRSRGEIILLGDSNAGQFSEPVTRAGNRAGFDVTVVTNSGCPYLGLQVNRRVDGPVKGCARFGPETLSAIIRRNPSLVILATRTDSYLEAWDDGLRAADSSAFTYDTASKVRLWRPALRSALLRLTGAGLHVVLVHPIPLLPFESNNCAVVRILAGECATEISRSEADTWLRLPVRVENQEVAAVPKTWALSFENEICGKTSCSSMRNGVVQYRDAQHLSVDGALMLTGVFYRAIALRAVPRRPS